MYQAYMLLLTFSSAAILFYCLFALFVNYSAKRAKSSPVVIAFLLALLLGSGLLSYFIGDNILSGDGRSHVARTQLFFDIIKDGEWPIWTNKWYLGFPLGLCHGFFYYLTTALVSLVSGLSPIFVSKVCGLVLHAASGLVFFKLSMTCGIKEKYALIAAFFYVYSYQHIGSAVLISALPLCLVFLLLPLLFLSFEMFADRKDEDVVPASLVSALIASCALLTHVQYGVYVVGAFFTVILLRCAVFLRFRQIKMSSMVLKYLLTTGIFTVFLTAWFYVPLMMEKQYLMLSRQSLMGEFFSGLSWGKFLHVLKRLFVPSREYDPTYFYLGVSTIICAVLGSCKAWFLKRRTDPVYWSYFLFFLLSAILAVRSRFINIWFFFLCLIAGWGVQFLLDHRLLKRRSNLVRKTLLISFLAFVVLDMSFTLIHMNQRVRPPYALLEGKDSGRLVVLYGSRSTLWRSEDYLFTGSSSVCGGIPQCSTVTHQNVAAFCAQAAFDVLDRHKEMSRTLIDAFRVMNVSSLLVPEQNKVLKISNPSPVIFAPELLLREGINKGLEKETWSSIRLKYEDRTLYRSGSMDVIATMALQAPAPIAKYIVMQDKESLQRVRKGRGQRNEGVVEFSIKDFHETHNTVRLSYTSNVSGFVQLSYSYFPTLKLKVDGEDVDIAPSALGMIVAAVPAGEHEITVSAGISRLRTYLIIAGILCMGGVLLIRHFRSRGQ